MSSNPAAWSPSTWRDKPIAQDVVYEDPAHLDRVLGKLRSLPPLVSPAEVDRLRCQLADVANGKAFLLQGGDCAELFDACSQDQIEHKLSLVLLMSLIILHGSRLPVVRIMRIAGQYAKPRSKPTEMIDGVEVLSFRGDNVNGYAVKDRKPDPERLLGYVPDTSRSDTSAYFHSTATLNYIRTLLSSGFADLHKPLDWSFSHVRSPELLKAFSAVIDNLEDSLDFMKVATGGSGGSDRGGTQTVDLYTSHEALLLEYEEALTRKDGSRKHYNLSSHFIWIGDRTRQLDGAHVEYFRGIANPIGIKVGPSMQPDELVRILDSKLPGLASTDREVVNPERIPGKVTLIGRYGAEKVETYLPTHIDAVKGTDHVVVWQCDAMHGNTKSSQTDPTLKTRHFVDIVAEITKSMEIHKAKGTILGGVHLELTGEINENGFSVTECIGGSMELEDKDLSFNYRTHCDPRLNYEQSLDVAFLISDHLKAKRRGEARKVVFGQH